MIDARALPDLWEPIESCAMIFDLPHAAGELGDDGGLGTFRATSNPADPPVRVTVPKCEDHGWLA